MAKFKSIKTKLWRGFLALLLVMASCCVPLLHSLPVHASVCDDVKIIFARGSGEELGDVSETAWRSSLTADLQSSNLKYSFYELGSKSQAGYQYPATAVGGSLESMINLIGASLSSGESFRFGESVNQGVNELRAYILSVSAMCPNTRFVLGGYSQGGMVISKAITQKLGTSKIIYAATFGDPKLYLPEGVGSDPAACRGEDFSNYRAYVPDCQTAEGILGGYNPYQKNDMLDKLGAWCNSKDIMCGATVNMFNLLGGHTSYTTQDLYQHAAHTISNKLAQALPGHGIKIWTRTDITSQDTAILIDSTGSMSPLINKYKSEAKRLAKKTLDSGGRVALYEYRDLFEDPESTIKHCDFGCSYDDFVKELDSIETAHGGDLDESALGALLQTMNTLDWQKGATKSIVLLTDAGYHMPDYDGTTLSDVTQRALEIDPVNVYTVAPESLRDEYAGLTEGTSGNFFNTEDDLAKVADYLTNRPIAVLSLDQYSGAPGETITFDASESVATNTIDHYEWDLDFDGVFETRTDSPKIQATYPNATTGIVQVRVVDKQNLVSTMSATVTIKTPEALAQILSLDSTKQDNSTYQIDFAMSTNAEMALVVVDGNIVGRTDRRSFILTDVNRVTSVMLVPFSHSGVRGTSSEITIYPSIGAPNTGVNLGE